MSDAYDKVKKWREGKENISELRAEEARKWRAAHPEKAKEIKNRYRARHRERILPLEAEQARIRRAKDPDGQKRRNREYLERLNAKKESQAGRPRATQCELCQEVGKTVFDHCHVSGLFRGWICDRCNKVLGMVKDSPELLVKMSIYLNNGGSNNGCPQFKDAEIASIQ